MAAALHMRAEAREDRRRADELEILANRLERLAVAGIDKAASLDRVAHALALQRHHHEAHAMRMEARQQRAKADHEADEASKNRREARALHEDADRDDAEAADLERAAGN